MTVLPAPPVSKGTCANTGIVRATGTRPAHVSVRCQAQEGANASADTLHGKRKTRDARTLSMGVIALSAVFVAMSRAPWMTCSGSRGHMQLKRLALTSEKPRGGSSSRR